MLARLKAILGITGSQEDEKLTAFLDMAEDTVLDMTGREVLPERLKSVCVELAVIAYNRQGTEGSASRSEGGISESYIDGLPDHLKKRLENYPKKVRVIRGETESNSSD